MVEGSFVLGRSRRCRRSGTSCGGCPSLRWVAIQVGLAALMAALARRLAWAVLARPRPPGPIGPRSMRWPWARCWRGPKAAPEARELLDRYRRWRYPRAPRRERHALPAAAGARITRSAAASGHRT